MVGRQGVLECARQATRLPVAHLYQQKFGPVKRRSRSALGSGADRGNQVQQVLHHTPCQLSFFSGQVRPVFGRLTFQIGNQLRHIHHHIPVVQAGCQFGVEDTGRTQFTRFAQQVVHHGEVVVFHLGLMYGEGVCDVNGCVAAGQHVGCDHATKQSGLQATAVFQCFDVFLFVLQKLGNGCLKCLGVGVFLRQFSTTFDKEINLGAAHQHSLPCFQSLLTLRLFSTFVQKPSISQALACGLRQVFRQARFNQLSANQIQRLPGAHGHGHTQTRQREMILGHTPVALQAL